MLELVAAFFILIGTQKKMLLAQTLVPTLKQQFIELINGTSQTNHQKLNLLLF